MSASIFTTYLLSKCLPDKTFIVYMLTASGILQVLIMCLQWNGLLNTESIFTITGSFDNPGPLGGYLSICTVACLGNYQRMNRTLYVLCTLVLGGALAFSNSRAAWLGTLLALLYIGMKHLHIKKGRQTVLLIATVTGFAIFSLTTYKTDSAKGRLTIWKISTEMIRKKTLFGNGPTSFQRNYMKYQADYLNRNPSDEANKILANNGIAFNEYLRIFYEQGIIGLGIVCTISVLLFREGARQNSPLLLCLISLAVFSFFSYPSKVFSLRMSAAMLAGALSDGKKIIVWETVPSFRKRIMPALYLLVAASIGSQWIKQARLENALSSFLYRTDPKSIKYLTRHYAAFNNNLDFMSRYARILYMKGEYISAIPVLKETILLYPTTDKYCDLGDMYHSLKQSDSAEKAYLCAIKLLPARIYPHYCLFCLYKETGQKEKATAKAYDILKLSPKKTTPSYEHIIFQIKQYITYL